LSKLWFSPNGGNLDHNFQSPSGGSREQMTLCPGRDPAGPGGVKPLPGSLMQVRVRDVTLQGGLG